MSKNNPDIKKIDEELEKIEKTNVEQTEGDYAEKIETGRKDLYTAFRKNKISSTILMVVLLGVAIMGFIFISNANLGLRIAGYISMGVAAVAIVVYHLLTRNIFPKKTKAYISLVTNSLNSRAFANNKYKDVTASNEDKLEIAELTSDGVYGDINAIGCRNVVKGHFYDRSFVVSDLALYKQAGKNRITHFIGKYLSLPNDLSFNGHYVFVKKNLETPVDVANNIEDLTILFEEEGYVIYGPEGTNYKEIFPKKLIDKIKEIELNNNLLNVNITLWGGHSAAYLSYSDAIIALPFDKEFDKAAFEEYVTLQDKVLELFATLLNK